jgi:cytochrome c oxidase subunit 2
MQRRQTRHSNRAGALLVFLAIFWSTATVGATEPAGSALSPTNIFAPVSTPAQSIFDLSVLVLMVTATIFVVVFSLLAYAAIKFRRRQSDDGPEPVQV